MATDEQKNRQSTIGNRQSPDRCQCRECGGCPWKAEPGRKKCSRCCPRITVCGELQCPRALAIKRGDLNA
jgi:hypothetical protein